MSRLVRNDYFQFYMILYNLVRSVDLDVCSKNSRQQQACLSWCSVDELHVNKCSLVLEIFLYGLSFHHSLSMSRDRGLVFLTYPKSGVGKRFDSRARRGC